MPAVPTEEEVEDAAVALQHPFLDGLDGDWFMLPIYKRVSRQSGSVELSGLVEPPVLEDP